MTKFNQILWIPTVINHQESISCPVQSNTSVRFGRTVTNHLRIRLVNCAGLVEATALFLDLDFLEPNCEIRNTVSRYTTNFTAINLFSTSDISVIKVSR
jgi:hypothetical protein